MKKICAIGYLRFNEKVSRAEIHSTQAFLKHVLAKEGFKIIGFVEAPKHIQGQSRIDNLMRQFSHPTFYGAKHIVTLRREMLGDTINEINQFIYEANNNGFSLYSYVDEDLLQYLELSLSYEDAIAKIISDSES